MVAEGHEDPLRRASKRCNVCSWIQSVWYGKKPTMKHLPAWIVMIATLAGLLAAGRAAGERSSSTALAAPPAAQLAAVSCAPDSGTGSIRGTVTAPGGMPVNNVTVEAYTPSGKRVTYTSTNSSGNYELSGLITGNYLLYFDTGYIGTAYAPEWYNNQATAATAIPVSVTDGVATPGIDVELAPGTQFSGQVIGDDGIPLQSVYVRVYDSSGDIIAGASTNAAGSYTTTPGVPSGDYRIFFDSPIGKPYLAEYYNDKATLDEATVLSVTAPDPQTGINGVLARAARISGRVTNAETGDPLPSISVSIYGEGGSDYATTDSNGEYLSDAGLQSGSYTVSFGPLFESQNFIRASQTVTVTAPNLLAGVDAALSPGGSLTGRVTDPGDTPLEDVSVYVSNEDGSYQNYVYTEADGTYTAVGLPSGSYRVFFRKNGFISESYDDKPGYQEADLVTVTAPDTTAGIDAVLSPGGSISGKVTDATSGDPIQGVFVEVLDDDGGRVESGFTNVAGEYTMSATLPSGDYFVRFNPDDRNASCGYVLEYYDDKFDRDSADPVSVTAPNTTANINAEMSPGSIIFGQVTDADTGAPLEGINVSVYDSAGERVASGRTTFLGGYLTSPALPSGDYRVFFRDYNAGYIDEYYNDKPSLETADAVPVTAPADVTGIDAALAQGGTISGRVTAADTGEAFAYVAVTVYDSDDQPVAYANTGQDGSYSVREGLPTGDYRIGFTPPGRFGELELASTQLAAEQHDTGRATIAQEDIVYDRGYLPVFYRNKLTLSAADPVQVTAPNETRDIDVVVPRGTYLPLIRR